MLDGNRNAALVVQLIQMQKSSAEITWKSCLRNEYEWISYICRARAKMEKLPLLQLFVKCQFTLQGTLYIPF